MMPSWMKHISRNRKRTPRARAERRRFRPVLETLEARALPSTYTVMTTADAGANSLRDAITYANANPGTTINFNIATAGVQTITLLSPLPAVTATGTIIDGTSEGGYSSAGVIGTGGTVGTNATPLPKFAEPLIAIDAGGSDGLTIGDALDAPTGVVIKSLAIYDASNGVVAIAGSGNTIQDMLIGTRADGSDPGALRNQAFGVMVDTPSQSGAPLPAQLNVTHCYVGWNAFTGVDGESSGSADPTTYASMNVTYCEVFGNGWNHDSQDGIDVNGVNSVIRYNLSHDQTAIAFPGDSNTVPAGGPYINGGGGSGVEIGSSGADPGMAINGNNVIEQNTLVNNLSAGVEIRKGNLNNLVDGNIITGNYVGISVRSEGGRPEYGNTLSQNSISGNTYLGIDLNADPHVIDATGDIALVPASAAFDGPTPNQSPSKNPNVPGDLAYSNLLENHPILSAAVTGNGSITIHGSLSSNAASTYTLEFFSGNTLDSNGSSEGQNYLGNAVVTTGVDGFASFTVTFAKSVAAGSYITATASGDPVAGGNANTSEFSPAIKASSAAVVLIEPCDCPGMSGEYQLVVIGTQYDDNIDVHLHQGSFNHPGIKYSVSIQTKMGSHNLGSFKTGSLMTNLPLCKVVVYGLNGNDNIHVDTDNTGVPAWLFGGDGNDTLQVDHGNNLLEGGPGNDLLKGGNGRDILIGGTGADTLQGGNGNDILIAGSTTWDDNTAALCAIMAEWDRTDPAATFQTRVNDLMGPATQSAGALNGPYYLNPSTVFSDTSVDKLNGGSGSDWLFYNFTGGGGPLDKVSGNTSGDVKTDIS